MGRFPFLNLLMLSQTGLPEKKPNLDKKPNRKKLIQLTRAADHQS
jgi:hypothetical protein